MADFSGPIVDTFNMTKGLYEAYSKARTEEQARQAKAAEMERAAYRTNAMRQAEDDFRNGKSTHQGLVGALFGSEQAAQALEAMKMPPKVWSQFGLQQPAGLPQGAAQRMPLQAPLPPPRPSASQAPQYEMPPVYEVRRDNPAPGQFPLDQVRRLNEDRANQGNGTRFAWPGRVRAY